MIKRMITDELLYIMANFPAVGLIGLRQVGKTTLVKQILAAHNNYVYLDLEKTSDRAKLSNAELYLSAQADKTIILDEVQFLPELFPLLRALIDENRKPGRFLILGSASPSLLRQSSESLAGRIAYLKLHPLNLLEVQNKAALNHLWLCGGFPETVLKNNQKFNTRWQQNFLDNYLQRDLPNYGLPANPSKSLQLMQMFSSAIGQTVNFSMLSKSLGISMSTVKNYFHFFENAFLVYRLQPWFQNSKKRLVKSSKLYFSDVGMHHHLAGINSYTTLLGHITAGPSWENFVINQIRSILPHEVQLYFYRTQDGAEIDLLARLNNSWLWGLEIKLNPQPKLSKGNYIAMQDLNLPQLMVVVPQAEVYPLDENIRVIGLPNLLVELNNEYNQN
jgi:predicted AAA+ superfamily ATPase